MRLLTMPLLEQLLKNGQAQAVVRGTDREIDLFPVVKLYSRQTERPPGSSPRSIPTNTTIAWGLCDLGVGCPEFGTVSLDELRAVRGRLGLGVERDLHWTPKGPISAYIDAATAAGRIVDLPSSARCTHPIGGLLT